MSARKEDSEWFSLVGENMGNLSVFSDPFISLFVFAMSIKAIKLI